MPKKKSEPEKVSKSKSAKEKLPTPAAKAPAKTAKSPGKPAKAAKPAAEPVLPEPEPADPAKLRSLVKEVRKPTRKVTPKAPEMVVITVEEISLRAYYIAEDRRRKGIPGDEHSDWVEAERQIHREKTSPK